MALGTRRVAVLTIIAVAATVVLATQLAAAARTAGRLQQRTAKAEATRPPERLLRADAHRGLIDGHNRVRLFHGVNVVYKLPPFVPQTDAFDARYSLAAEDIKTLQSLGVRAVRLLVSWPGTEPTRGEYDEDYLSRLEGIVNALGEADIVSLLDMHQDLFSPMTCGNGVPDWAAHAPPLRPLTNDSAYAPLAFPAPVGLDVPQRNESTGYPTHKYCSERFFAEYYLSSETGVAFQALYDDVAGIRQSFVRFWTKIASRFAGNANVLGYEVINEPWGGDVYRHPWRLGGRRVDREVLAPLYDEVSAAIRKVDAEALLFFEPTVVTSSLPFPSIGEAVGFERPPLGSENRSILSYHTYCPAGSLGEKAGQAACDAYFDQVFGTHLPDATRTAQVPAFLTEWGALTSGQGFDAWTAHEVAKRADELFLSWTYWQFKGVPQADAVGCACVSIPQDFGDPTTQASDKGGVPHEGIFNVTSGELDTEKASLLARPYAHAVAGVVGSHTFDVDARVFTLTYVPDAAATAATEITWSPTMYEDGIYVTISPHGCCQVDAESKVGLVTVSVTSPPAAGGNVSVLVGAYGRLQRFGQTESSSRASPSAAAARM